MRKSEDVDYRLRVRQLIERSYETEARLLRQGDLIDSKPTDAELRRRGLWAAIEKIVLKFSWRKLRYIERQLRERGPLAALEKLLYMLTLRQLRSIARDWRIEYE